MEPLPCVHCECFFTPRNRCQIYCGKKTCQKARKAAWHKSKMRFDQQYKSSQKLSQKKWVQNNPGYWKQYRQQNPEKNRRNQILQRVRNRKRNADSDTRQPLKSILIAKMDPGKFNEPALLGEFLMVPMIAKMDATKVVLRMI